MEFENACSEVYYILEHLNQEEQSKIPIKVKEFFKNNSSVFYKTNIDETKGLSLQTLTDETKAILKILYIKYFANQEEKDDFSKLINSDIKTTFEENYESNENDKIQASDTTTLIVYKENKLLKLFKNFINLFKKKS